MELANKIQAVLLVFYLVLAVLFFKQNQWPVAIYYLGCIIKDAAVFILAWLEKR